MCLPFVLALTLLLLLTAECKFHCTNGNCLRLGSLICNQLNNCGDNSDEENCPVVTQHPPPGIFNCECHHVLPRLLSHAQSGRFIVIQTAFRVILSLCGHSVTVHTEISVIVVIIS